MDDDRLNFTDIGPRVLERRPHRGPAGGVAADRATMMFVLS